MDDVVSEKVNTPGLALIVMGLLSLLTNVGMLAWLGFTTVTVLMAGDVDWTLFITSQGWQLVMTLLGVFTSFVIMLGGVRLRQQRGAGLVYFASIISMLPCCVGVPCCCIGLPIGGWVLSVMQDDQVKTAFEG